MSDSKPPAPVAEPAVPPNSETAPSAPPAAPTAPAPPTDAAGVAAVIASGTNPTTGKKLTNKELKDLKKQEKALRRAAAKSAVGAPASAAAHPAPGPQNTAAPAAEQKSRAPTRSGPSGKNTVALFGHLEPHVSVKASSGQHGAVVHPEIATLALKFSTYEIIGSRARCKAMLSAFKGFIRDYTTPPGTSISRNLTATLSHQIDYLKTARPLSISMGNAIRWLKREISVLSLDLTEEQAKQLLASKIDAFAKEKLDLADVIIVESTADKHISDGDIVLTYGHSSVLAETFEYAYRQLNKRFTVIVADSRPLFEGRRLVRRLSKAGIRCIYVLVSALPSVLDKVNTVFLGAHGIFSNGRLYSRVGTAVVAMAASARNIPVLVCAESIKLSDRVVLDSVSVNELGDASQLEKISNEPPVSRNSSLEAFLAGKQAEAAAASQQTSGQKKGNRGAKEVAQQADTRHLLHGWKDIEHLSILNVMFDLTPPDYIKKIITELGSLPPSSVPVILREYKSIQ